MSTQVRKYASTQVRKYASTQVRKYASTQVRKYASTLKASAILIAGLWLGLVGTVSAKTDIPHWADCIVWDKSGSSWEIEETLVDSLLIPIARLAEELITVDEFNAQMNNLLTKPDLINCTDHFGYTIAHHILGQASIAAAKWAV